MTEARLKAARELGRAAKRRLAVRGGALGQCCWYCLKELKEVKQMVEADTGARICDECVGQCIEIMGLWKVTPT